MEIKINQSRNYSSFSTTKTFQDLSGEIGNLMTQYKQLKKNRIQTEQDKCFLENKMKVLTKEQNKIKLRKNSAEKLRDRYNIIRVNVLNQKKLVNQRKNEIEKEKQLKKQNSQNIKRTIETTLSSWRIKVNSRNREEGMKVKKEKRQREGIQAKKDRGEWADYGRPVKMSIEEFRKEYQKVLEEEMKPFELMKQLGLSKSTFYRYVNQLR